MSRTISSDITSFKGENDLHAFVSIFKPIHCMYCVITLIFVYDEISSMNSSNETKKKKKPWVYSDRRWTLMWRQSVVGPNRRNRNMFLANGFTQPSWTQTSVEMGSKVIRGSRRQERHTERKQRLVWSQGVRKKQKHENELKRGRAQHYRPDLAESCGDNGKQV